MGYVRTLHERSPSPGSRAVGLWKCTRYAGVRSPPWALVRDTIGVTPASYTPLSLQETSNSGEKKGSPRHDE